jgi:hypothetical protein
MFHCAHVFACQCAGDLKVMQAYQTGVAALRLALKDVTVEGAESLVDQIQEVALRFQLLVFVFVSIHNAILTCVSFTSCEMFKRT